jgi:ABC-2 type transport system permease protein
MHPIYCIARRELAERWRDGRLLWCAVSLCVLLATSFGFGWHTYEIRSSQRRAIQDSERARWLAQRYRSPHVAAGQGVYVFRPEPLLASLDPGVDSFIGIATHAEEGQHFFIWKPAEDELVAHRFGEVSVASVFQFVAPLLIIVLLYSTFTRDRETGILRLTMSLGVKRWHYVAGKLLGGLAPALVLVPAFLSIAIALRVMAGEAAFARAAPALTWMGVSYLLLFATFTALSLAVSATAKSSRTALLFLLFCWCLTGFIVPHLAIALEERLSPAPTAAHVLNNLHLAAMAERTHADEARDIEIELMQQYHARDLADLPVSPVGVFRTREAARGKPISNATFDSVYNSYLSHDRLMQWISVASPNLAVQSISSALAGTGPAAFVDVAHAAEDYRYPLVQTMNRDIVEHCPATIPGHRLADDYHRGIEVWSQVPAFSYQSVDLKTTIVREHVAWSVSILWCILAIAFAAFRISRMKVDA